MGVFVSGERSNGLVPAASVSVSAGAVAPRLPGPPSGPGREVNAQGIGYTPRFSRIMAGIQHSGRPAK